jgi:hypothetical protein
MLPESVAVVDDSTPSSGADTSAVVVEQQQRAKQASMLTLYSCIVAVSLLVPKLYISKLLLHHHCLNVI